MVKTSMQTVLNPYSFFNQIMDLWNLKYSFNYANFIIDPLFIFLKFKMTFFKMQTLLAFIIFCDPNCNWNGFSFIQVTHILRNNWSRIVPIERIQLNIQINKIKKHSSSIQKNFLHFVESFHEKCFATTTE